MSYRFPSKKKGYMVRMDREVYKDLVYLARQRGLSVNQFFNICAKAFVAGLLDPFGLALMLGEDVKEAPVIQVKKVDEKREVLFKIERRRVLDEYRAFLKEFKALTRLEPYVGKKVVLRLKEPLPFTGTTISIHNQVFERSVLDRFYYSLYKKAVRWIKNKRNFEYLTEGEVKQFDRVLDELRNRIGVAEEEEGLVRFVLPGEENG